jgi:hypothetical protein
MKKDLKILRKNFTSKWTFSVFFYRFLENKFRNFVIFSNFHLNSKFSEYPKFWLQKCSIFRNKVWNIFKAYLCQLNIIRWTKHSKLFVNSTVFMHFQCRSSFFEHWSKVCLKYTKLTVRVAPRVHPSCSLAGTVCTIPPIRRVVRGEYGMKSGKSTICTHGQSHFSILGTFFMTKLNNLKTNLHQN